MNRELAEHLVHLLQDSGEEADLRTDYSGRGMYGSTTAGIVCSGTEVILYTVLINIDQFVEEGCYPIYENIDEFRTDSMGR